MNFELKTPCKDCPFRTDVKPYLRKERAKGISRALKQEQGAFPCHKTVTYDDNGEKAGSRKEQHCAGALVMLERMNRPNQLMRIAQRLGVYKPQLLDMDAPVFDNTTQFIAHFADQA